MKVSISRCSKCKHIRLVDKTSGSICFACKQGKSRKSKLEKIKELANLYPQEAMRKLYSHLRNMSINEFLRKKVLFKPIT